MIESPEVLLVAAIFLIAVLYSSVGHAGASGYLAVMALFSVAGGVTKPTALVLNVFVAIVATAQFYRRGHFDWRVFFAFAVSSVPLAFVGGAVSLPEHIYKPLLGLVLLIAAVRLAWNFAGANAIEETPAARPVWLAPIFGAIIGLLSGLTGVGGGIFLTPILLLTRWTETKKAAGISAMFILVNSISGLLGNYEQAVLMPPSVWIWVIAAVAGGLLGSTLGSARFNTAALRRILSIVLLIAGLKMIFT